MEHTTSTTLTRWHAEVPGTRWFRADLHLHTLDDAIGGNVTWQAPAGVAKPNDPSDPSTRAAYVRCYLRAAIDAGIDVLGLTPHSAHVPGNTGLSVVWDIVEAWRTANDDDGTPFREKIYAVFPGFEPSASDGKGGIHLLVLFDPEIGKDRFIRAFTVATGGRDVWHEARHQTSPKDAKAIMDDVRQLKVREGNGWDFLFIAPHAFSEKGVVDSLKGDLGKYFEHGGIAALELKDNHLAQDAIDAHAYLREHLKRYCQPLIHGSDAYGLLSHGNLSEVPRVDSPGKRGIGYRHTLLKLASPRIESLRQAFLSSDSRLRTVYQKDATDRLQYRPDIPIPLDAGRPWLRSVTIEEGTSFFGGKGRRQVVRLSPDLTCIIGGRMTGKSTLLDGLRTYCKIAPPQAADLARDVEQRSARFLSGNPKITLDIAGPIAGTLSPGERWPARFFTQRELASIPKDADSVRKVIYRLASPARTLALFEFDDKIAECDRSLQSLTQTLMDARAALAEKEQAFATAEKARWALDAFKEAGADGLAVAQADRGRATAFASSIATVKQKLIEVGAALSTTTAPTIDSLLAPQTAAIVGQVLALRSTLATAERQSSVLAETSAELLAALSNHAASLRAGVQEHLVDQGRNADELNQFESLSTLAAEHEGCRKNHDAARVVLADLDARFSSLEIERDGLLAARRAELAAIIEELNRTIGSVRVHLSSASPRAQIEEWLKGLKEPGITRWWNANTEATSPGVLYAALVSGKLSELGMSETVALRFTEQMSSERRYQLRAMRSEDSCSIAARVGSGENDFRPLNRLSGGKQISVLLSLLLESSDTSPLVIDQPEDELDKPFLTDTLLPILRRLKGKRQIVFATHDANLVVNGDADQVVHLEADAERAEVSTQDAIDNDAIRHAVLTVLDGGKDAFDLRKRKYGF